jgi:ankyrin repeat protein
MEQLTKKYSFTNGYNNSISIKQDEFLNKIRLKENYSNILKYYTENKLEIDLNKSDPDKRTPLINAVTSKNFDAVKFLLEKENNVKINKADSVFIYNINNNEFLVRLDCASLCMCFR